MTTDRQKLVERVQKLLALSQSPNQHEAELAAQRASELMEKYQIDMDEAALTDAKKIDVDTEYYEVEGLRMKYAWVTRLTWASARLFDCELMDMGGLHGVRVVFVGYPDDIAMAKSMFEYLYSSWNIFVWRDLAKAKAEVKVLGRSFTPRDTMKYKLGHGQGYASALFNRVDVLVRARREKVQASGATGTALVIVKDTGVKDKLMELGARDVKRREQRGYGTGRNDGSAAGNTVVLGGNLPGTGSTKRIG